MDCDVFPILNYHKNCRVSVAYRIHKDAKTPWKPLLEHWIYDWYLQEQEAVNNLVCAAHKEILIPQYRPGVHYD